MEFENQFEVPVPPPAAWRALMDIEQVAACMPGATLLKVEGDTFEGKVKVKVGPISITYLGQAEFAEKDESAGRIVLVGRGKEERGSGTAAMRVTAALAPVGDERTQVTVLTDLDISGRPAQFGRGVIGEVGSGIIRQFSERLTAHISADEHGVAEDAGGQPGPASSTVDASGPRLAGSARSRPAGQPVDGDSSSALDLASVIPPELKLKVAVGAAGLAGLAIGVLLARRGRGASSGWPAGQPPVLVVINLRPAG